MHSLFAALVISCTSDKAADDTSTPTVPTTPTTTAAVDADGDGYASTEDCDDADPAIHPGAVEVCDPAGVDEDCSGQADDADPGVDPASQTRWCPDEDGDLFGGDACVSACDPPQKDWLTDDSDCDDTSASTHPGAAELESAEACMKDSDGDGFGDSQPAFPIIAGGKDEIVNT